MVDLLTAAGHAAPAQTGTVELVGNGCQPRQCGHCRASDVGTFAAGYASITTQTTTEGGPEDGKVETTMTYLCHPNVAGRMDCYRLVTVYDHATPCGNCRSMFPAAGPRDARTPRD